MDLGMCWIRKKGKDIKSKVIEFFKKIGFQQKRQCCKRCDFEDCLFFYNQKNQVKICFEKEQSDSSCPFMKDLTLYAKYDENNDNGNKNIVFEVIYPIEIKSVSDYLSVIKSLSQINGSKQYYRGHSSVDYKLIPSIYRDEYIKKEKELFHEAIIRNCDEFPKSMSTFDKLVKMQHYGLPTRLLDITESPLTALYFAVKKSEKKENSEKDGVVYIFNIPKDEIKYYDSDSVCVVSNLVKQKADYSMPKIKQKIKDKYDEHDPCIEEFNGRNEIKILLHDIDDDKPGFVHRIWPDTLTSVLCVKAKMENKRIIRQDGAFLLFGMEESKNQCADLPYCPIKIIIKKENKNDIRAELEKYAIDEMHMFPEIEDTMKCIKSKIEKEIEEENKTNEQNNINNDK